MDLNNVDRGHLDELCRRYGVARIDVFGSVARGEDREGSDVDLLYELRPGVRLGWDIETLSDELADLLGRPVDLVSRRALHPRLRDRVLAEARTLYAA
ncbi:MAG: nucleotidyltransferase family protein [Pseudonocardiaceae bacterium]